MDDNADTVKVKFYPEWYDGPVQGAEVEPEGVDVMNLAGFTVEKVEVTLNGDLVFTFKRPCNSVD